MFDVAYLPPELIQFFRYGAIVGFISATTLVINLNHKAFNRILGENARSYWWLFVISALIPLLIALYIFSLLFGSLTS